ncbi:MAG TPA: PQQ-binding-like beta-propeller repeat protein, partial [Rhizomicrobium sp.]|nr:PQQ-binding-like beta-propeller repeat protein [Rhizomicrobium sp.]
MHRAIGTMVAGALALLAFCGAAQAADCAGTPALKGFASAGWGIDARNTRYQPKTTITAANVARLRLKWTYGLSSDAPRSYPLVSDDTIFLGDAGHGVVALNRRSGCARWTSPHTGYIGTAIVQANFGGKTALFFNDRYPGHMYALNASNGAALWDRRGPGDNPVVMLSGTPLVDGPRMYVPLSSLEIGLVANPFYGCCTTSGGMAAVKLSDGATLWHRRSIPGQPKLVGHHFIFVEEFAPSGAPVWGPATLDAASNTIFFGTGQNYSRPATTTSDSIFAVNAADGSVRWVHQFHKDDAYNIACDISSGHPNCPKPLGPDLDFGAPTILAHTKDGRTLLLAGEKSGQVYALDPVDGHVVWTKVAGRGGALGGVHWGMAVNEQLGLLYVPVSDVDAGKMSGPGKARAGLYAYDIATGELRWSHLRTPRCADRTCSPGLSAAIIAGPDLVFAGSLDGKLEAYDAQSGKVLWSYDSWRDYANTVNGVAAHGGAFDAHGPLLAGDQMMVSSGYNSFGEKGGNA